MGAVKLKHRSVAFSRCPTTDKRGYRSKLSALTVASRASRSAPQRAYFCPFCRRWHLTSQPKRYAEEGMGR